MNYYHNFAKQLEDLESMPEPMMSERQVESRNNLRCLKEQYDAHDERCKRFELNHRYYDKMGKPISFWEFSGYSADLKYKIIAQNTFGYFFVSTVWLGLDHGFSFGLLEKNNLPYFPIIFETMIFYENDKEEIDHELHDYQERYASEEQAKQGHDAACELAAKAAYEIAEQRNKKWWDQQAKEKNKENT